MTPYLTPYVTPKCQTHERLCIRSLLANGTYSPSCPSLTMEDEAGRNAGPILAI